MRSTTWMVWIVGVVLAAGLTGAVVAQQQGNQTRTSSRVTPAETTARIVAAAERLLATLDDAARAKVQFPFDAPQKTRWSNLPVGAFKREGLRLGDLTATQRTAAMNLLSTALSARGYQKVTEIMHGDEVLRRTGTTGPGGGRVGTAGRGPGGPPPDGAGRGRGMPGGGMQVAFGEDEYYLALVGRPSTTESWMLQFGGHHLAINLTIGGSQASLTPSHTAAQPATYTVEGRTVRPLGAENDKAFALINALDGAQRGEAVLKYRVPDLVLGPGQDGRTIQPEGIRASALNASQQSMLLELIEEWAGIMTDVYADIRMAEIKTNLPQTYFAWSGPTANPGASYFRIQGPTLVIEYAPQNGVDHIHTIYRDPSNDYGAKFAGR